MNNFLKKEKRNNILVKVMQLSIGIIFLISWELLSRFNIINSFIFSSPTKILMTIVDLYKNNNLFNNIWVTLYELFISFGIGSSLGFIIALLFYKFSILKKIFDPYLTLLNSLPKVALGPLLIIWIGANTNSIIAMALLISSIISIINIYNGFSNTDIDKIKLMRSFKASKWQIYKLLILRGNMNTIISSLKINISMCLIGVIMGELLVSKEGIGYLIMYGSQVFNLNLVMTGIFLLAIISYILYAIVSYIEKKLVYSKN